MKCKPISGLGSDWTALTHPKLPELQNELRIFCTNGAPNIGVLYLLYANARHAALGFIVKETEEWKLLKAKGKQRPWKQSRCSFWPTEPPLLWVTTNC